MRSFQIAKQCLASQVGSSCELQTHLGHVEDPLFDESTWAIGEFVIDTRNWLPGRRVLLGPQAIEHVDWAVGAISVTRTRERLKEAPEFDARQLRAGNHEGGLRSADHRNRHEE